MSDNIDARGLSCPQPVILTQKAIDSGKKGFDILLDSAVSRENVIRCLDRNGLKYEISDNESEYIISVK
jgi:tRNA 2-thiouridine synthesizing protein A